MVIHPACGATKALIRQNANHMGQQVGFLHVWSKHTHAHTDRLSNMNFLYMLMQVVQ